MLDSKNENLDLVVLIWVLRFLLQAMTDRMLTLRRSRVHIGSHAGKSILSLDKS
jgi:hypothetical protein